MATQSRRIKRNIAESKTGHRDGGEKLRRMKVRIEEFRQKAALTAISKEQSA